jgi:putative ABC transport system ATP-binding protein
MPVLEARGLAKTYAADGVEVLALRGVDLTVEPSEFLSIMGPSGCGKSTLLHLLAGLDRPTAGSIALDGRDVTHLTEAQWAVARRRQVGFVFQFFNLVPDLTVAENVELPARLIGADPRSARRRRVELLERLGVNARPNTLPSRLSGGQQQRVAIARALVNRPSILMADEPTGNLDSESAAEVLVQLRELQDEGQTVVLVTHDARVAATGSRVVSMRDGLVTAETAFDPGAARSAAVSALLRLEVS